MRTGYAFSASGVDSKGFLRTVWGVVCAISEEEAVGVAAARFNERHPHCPIHTIGAVVVDGEGTKIINGRMVQVEEES
jgi:uncharacterized Zn-binding protein involved in type VI secretion